VAVKVGNNAPGGVVTDRRYRAFHTGDVVRLEDSASNTTVSICPTFGNNAFEMRVNGVDLLWRSHESLDDFKAHDHGRGGIPFLAPWANRLDELALYANGRRFPFDMEIGNIRGATAIHGLLMRTNGWKVTALTADDNESSVTSRLEFFRAPLCMKQFPFAHVIEMTHQLRDGALAVRTRIDNLSVDPMPMTIGFHPYFRLSDSQRDEWTVAIPARTRWLLSAAKLPTGETEPIERSLPQPHAVSLKGQDLDHVFSNLLRNNESSAVMSVSGRKQRIDVAFGPGFRAAVVYAPPSSSRPVEGSAGLGDFVCLEPMAGITNAMNLAHRGVYDDLQYIPAGGSWEETFRISPSGF
jgi:aldose 1-epimerase